MWPFKKKEPRTAIKYRLTPKEDITAYEVALLLAGRGKNNEEIRELPDCALRHITEVVCEVDDDGFTIKEIHYRPALKHV